MRQRLSARTIVVAAAVVLAVLPAVPAGAVEVRVSGTSRVLGDVTHERLEVRLGSGALARGDVLWFREDDPDIDLRPRLARGTVAGLQQMVPLSQNRMAQGAIAGVNGGYWLPRPTGAPNGLHISGGRLHAGQAVTGFGQGGVPTGRGMVGIQPSGRMVMDEILVDLTLDQPDSTRPAARIDELNRQVWPPSALLNGGGIARPDGELLLYDDRYGASIIVPGGSTLVVAQDLEVRSSGRSEGQVVGLRRVVYDTTFAVPPGFHVLLAYGNRAELLAELTLEQRVGVTTSITPRRTPAQGWEQLQGGVAGGQLLVQDGARRPAGEWAAAAAFSGGHAYERQPRTAIGRTADGRGMLVTVDGRLSGWSAGVTVGELADVMLSLGAVDAVNLDGGGSTTMTVQARIRNRPSQAGRSVADGLFLHAPLPPPSRALDQACPDGAVPATGFSDVPGTTHAAAISCLAWWEVTRGVTDVSFVPDAGVTREQMASFVVSWIDGVSARGSGTPLPDTEQRRFSDVSESNVHARSIARLSEAGIIRGRTDTSYEPREVMTRGQTASLLRAAVGYVTGAALPAARDTFMDDNGSVHEDNIDGLAAQGVIAGTGGFDFRPGDPVTRGAMAALIMRSSDLVVEQGRATPPG